MNRRFGVPALAGSDRLKAGHQTNLATQGESVPCAPFVLCQTAARTE